MPIQAIKHAHSALDQPGDRPFMAMLGSQGVGRMKRILSLMLVTICSSSAICAPSPADLADYKHFGGQLMALINAAQEKGEISQLKTPEVMSLVRSVSDEGKVLRTSTYTVGELGTLFDICDVANKASVSLMLFGRQAHLSPEANQQQAQTVALMDSNTLAFQDELRELQPFLLRCTAKQIRPMSEFITSLKPADFTDVRRQGLTQMRSGLFQMYEGALQAATDTRYSDEYRLALLAAMAENSDSFALAIELPVRRQLHELTRVAAAKAAESYKHHLDRIARSLSSEACDGLCAIR